MPQEVTDYTISELQINEGYIYLFKLKKVLYIENMIQDRLYSTDFFIIQSCATFDPFTNQQEQEECKKHAACGSKNRKLPSKMKQGPELKG